MTHLLPNHRIRIPNGVAIFAAILLLVSSVVGYEASMDVHSSGNAIPPTANVKSVEKDGTNDATQHQSRGLNLGLLLFRRG